MSSRSFAFEVYEDSAPAQWLDILRNSHVPFFVSPRHDQDEKESGGLKKPHYHVELLYSGKHTLDTVQQKFGLIAANGFIASVDDSRAYARYLTHRDNPEKHLYDWRAVTSSGYSYVDYIINAKDKSEATDQIIEYIKLYNVKHVCELVDFSLKNDRFWYLTLRDSSMRFFDTYLKSRRDYMGY